MRTKYRVIFSIVGYILFFFCMEGRGADWKLYAERQNGTFYYDAESITRPSKGVIRVWDKAVYTEKAITAITRGLGEKYKTLGHFKNSIELYCPEKKARVLQIVYCSKDGSTLDSYDYRREPEWKFIVSGGVLDDLYKILCKTELRTNHEDYTHSGPEGRAEQKTP